MINFIILMNITIIITGGSRGIGAATALLSAEQGYNVVINYLRNQQAAEDLVKVIEQKGGKAIAIVGDVSKETDVINLFKTAEVQFGYITSLVNNAGILAQQSLLQNMSVERWQRIFATNVTGSFLCTREAVKRMSLGNGGKGGAIVNVSSAATKFGSPSEYVDYAATKGAIDVLTIGLAKEVAADNIRVNAVRPGIIATEIHASGGDPNRPERLKDAVPMKRPGEAQEVANAILWLLSDEASYVTGTIMDVTGGR
jgi:NAD(P)-dependent dehydrogenase (short-subunit alcohol dehydrogenase family)